MNNIHVVKYQYIKSYTINEQKLAVTIQHVKNHHNKLVEKASHMYFLKFSKLKTNKSKICVVAHCVLNGT